MAEDTVPVAVEEGLAAEVDLEQLYILQTITPHPEDIMSEEAVLAMTAIVPALKLVAWQ